MANLRRLGSVRRKITKGGYSRTASKNIQRQVKNIGAKHTQKKTGQYRTRKRMQ